MGKDQKILKGYEGKNNKAYSPHYLSLMGPLGPYGFLSYPIGSNAKTPSHYGVLKDISFTNYLSNDHEKGNQNEYGALRGSSDQKHYQAKAPSLSDEVSRIVLGIYLLKKDSSAGLIDSKSSGRYGGAGKYGLSKKLEGYGSKNQYNWRVYGSKNQGDGEKKRVTLEQSIVNPSSEDNRPSEIAPPSKLPLLDRPDLELVERVLTPSEKKESVDDLSTLVRAYDEGIVYLTGKKYTNHITHTTKPQKPAKMESPLGKLANYFWAVKNLNAPKALNDNGRYVGSEVEKIEEQKKAA